MQHLIIDHASIRDFYFSQDKQVVQISHLRDKIEQNTKKPTYIKTIRGLGYKLEEPKGDE
ncbi:winged helix-turn-helix domain-containing protein [Bacillus sp. D-CC]